MKSLKPALCSIALLILSACGGGGSGTVTPLQTTNLPVSATFENIFTSAGTYTATTADGAKSITLTLTPGADAQFSPSTASSKTVNFHRVISQNGNVLDTQSSTMYFNTRPLTFVAVEGRAVDQSSVIDATSNVGVTGYAYMSSGLSFSVPIQEGKWSLEQSGDKVFLCLTNTNGWPDAWTPGRALTTTVKEYCFAVNGSGRINGFKARQSVLENTYNGFNQPITNVIETLNFQ